MDCSADLSINLDKLILDNERSGSLMKWAVPAIFLTYKLLQKEI
jgi:hypothetical protein